MKKQQEFIQDPKFVMKAAQAVWAGHKYFVLGCDQAAYLAIRKYLRPDDLHLKEAYQVLQKVTDDFEGTASQDLPQLSNGLYHMAGYFKKQLTKEEKSRLTEAIQEHPSEALQQLEAYTWHYDVAYLKMASIWPKHRNRSFQQVPTTIKHQGIAYTAGTLFWEGDQVCVSGTIRCRKDR